MLIDSSDPSQSLVFTAYSLTSDYVSNGQCVTTSGRSIPLNPPYTVFRETSVLNSDFYRYAVNSLAMHIGFSLCGTVYDYYAGTATLPFSHWQPNLPKLNIPNGQLEQSCQILEPPPTLASSLTENTVTSAPLLPHCSVSPRPNAQPTVHEAQDLPERVYGVALCNGLIDTLGYSIRCCYVVAAGLDRGKSGIG